VRQKHVPLRTCLGCGESGAKRELARIVRRPDGSIVVDPTGKQPGRGAYIHRNAGCWAKVVAGGRLAHALKATPTAEERQRLLDQLTLLEIEEHLEGETASGAADGAGTKLSPVS
jgi:uncharacterized protein